MRLISWLLAIITLAGTLARLLPLGLSTLPWLSAVVSVTPWFVVTGLVALVTGIASRHARATLVMPMLLCLALQLAWQGPFFSHVLDGSQDTVTQESTEAQDSSGTTVRVMTCNVYRGAADPARIVELVREQGVQVLALQETTTEFVEQLQSLGLDELLPYSQRSSSDGIYGNGVWAARPLSDTATDDIGSSASAMPAGTIQLQDTTAAGLSSLRFVSVHTTSPVDGYWELWRKSVEELGCVRTRLQDDPARGYVLMGDFNATYDHAPFRAMLGDTLEDAARQAGEGLTLSWPSSSLIPAFCAIDHVVVSPGITASNLSVATVSGSDHKALLCTLTL